MEQFISRLFLQESILTSAGDKRISMKKAIFFDIDGTLCDNNENVPESTVEAIRKLKENGVYIFLCSGRGLAFMKNLKLLDLGFDGILAGSGTYASFQEEELLYETIAPEKVKKTIKVLKQYELPFVLEGKEYYYADKEDFKDHPFWTVLEKDVKEKLVGISKYEMEWKVSKFAAFVKKDNFRKALEELSDIYTFHVHNNIMIEGVPKGFNKASGIRFICERLGISHENTYAFGDSVNDVEMLKYVAHGIAMGNGMQEAKDAADYVTNGIHENGIYNACKYFSLITSS